MSISEPFIRHPVATTLLTVGVLLAGFAAYRELPVSTLPQVEYPTIQVTTFLPGASAETMASSVTTPLERQFGQMPALSQMSSTSSFGNSLIALQFDLDRNIDAAEQDVQAAINAAATFLPPTLPAPPVYAKTNPADTPILTLAAMSRTMPLPEVDDAADSILAQKIAQATGVGLVSINGSQKPAVRVQLDPVALAGVGLSLEDVRGALVLANVNQPKGNIDGPRLDFTIASNDQLLKAKYYEPLVLAVRNDAPVRLSDVGRAVDGVENALLAGWANQRRAVILNVWRQPGANVIATADRVKELLPRLRSSLPRGLEVQLLNDRTETVRASVRDVQETLVLTVLLVVAVNFLFLGSLRAMVIPGVAVPLSLVATFGVMYLCDYSLDNLSLMALTISTGFVVDDAIVMVENVSRYVEAGDPPLQAALKGSKQIGFTIVSLTVSLVAVLIPLLFMGGLIGRLFREFAVTLSIAIAASALISLTLTAMMSAHVLRPHKERAPGRVGRWSESMSSRMSGFYRRTLTWSLEHPLFMLLLTLGTVALTGLLAFVIPKGFFPQQDTGLIQGISQAPADTSFQRMMSLQQSLADVVLRDPDVAEVASFIGADGTNPTPNSGRLLMTLKPREKRKASAAEIIARLQPKLAEVQGVALYLQAVQDLQIDARVSRTQFQLTLDDASAPELHAWAPRAVERLRKLPPSCATWPRTSSSAAGSWRSPSIATPPTGSASPRRRSTTRSTTRSGSASSRPSSRSSTSTA
jgi:multidrug efflux pump